MDAPREPPSPVIPMIVLFLLGTLMTLPSLITYDPNYWTSTIAQVQTHFIVGAFLIPVCLFLAVQAFGIPQVNPMEPRTPSPFMESITQNMTTLILLVAVIFFLLMFIPLRSVFQGSWQPPPTVVRDGWW